MKQTNRFWKFVLSSLFITLVITGVILFFFFKSLNEEQTLAILSIVNNYPGFILSIASIWIYVSFAGLEIIYQTYIKPIKKISSEVFLIYTSNPSHRLQVEGVKDVRNLALVINDFADLFEKLNNNITEQILVARQELEKEKNLLAAIMAELPQGIIICNNNGRILLFNSIAKKIFTQGTILKSAKYFIGLGRSIFHLIDKELVAHALDEIRRNLNNDKQGIGFHFITPIITGYLISVEIIPTMLDGKKQIKGFILMFQDVTDRINQYEITNKHLLSLKKDITGEKTLKKYEEVSEIILDSIITHLPLTKLFLPYFLKTIESRLNSLHGIELVPDNKTNRGRIVVDAYSFMAAFVFLIKNLSDFCKSKRINLLCYHDNKNIVFEITWMGNPIPTSQVEDILLKRINLLPSIFYVLKQNMTEIQAIPDKNGQCSKINIIANAELKVQIKKKESSPVIADSRPEFYDFDLFKTDDNFDLFSTRLDKITYTVFDTETTGLNPYGGDEILSIAAVRIVNNRIAYQDVFEELIDPQRDIPIDSYKIHGINYEMVEGKKNIAEILPDFKQFVSDTVLLGHNIAFDMKMLKMKEKSTGIKLLNPILDTLLLSAVLHPVHKQHDMENIARRLGVNIIGRHTALGDAIATAEIFLKLLVILKSNGILTLKDAIKASKRTYYARLKY